MKSGLKKILVGTVIAASMILPTASCSKAGEVNKLEEKVLAQTVDYKTVMFGEKHLNYTYDSQFVIGILPELKKQGFSYLAVEINRNNSDDEFNDLMTDYVYGKIKREDMSRSIYLEIEGAAPGWLHLIDIARDNGFEIIPYDANFNEMTSFNHREEISLKNLKEMIFDKDPDAKVILYCGSAHLNEKEIVSEDIAEFEWNYGMIPNSDMRYKCIGNHLDDFTNGKNLTISLDPAYEIEYCDLDLGDRLNAARVIDEILGTD